MKPIQSILVATDFSATAGRAEERAALLAAQHEARLTLLYCLSGVGLERLRNYLLHGFARTEAQLLAYYESVLRRQAEVLAGRWRIEVTPLLTVGQPHREITRAATDRGVDLIVLGAMGEHPAREFFLGSTADRVIREAAVPVLVVRNEPNEMYRRVLVALDLSTRSLAVAETARRIAPAEHLTLVHAFEVLFEGKLHFAGVSEEDIQRYRQEERQSALTALYALAEGLQARLDVRVEHGVPEAVIPDLLRDTAADLVVAGKHGSSEIVDLFLGSMTNHLLREAGCDVLVVPPALEIKT